MLARNVLMCVAPSGWDRLLCQQLWRTLKNIKIGTENYKIAHIKYKLH